jgi:hypothetical protein
MQFNRTTTQLPLARILALVALLCAGALQVQEAGHWHELDDSYSHCLVCKSSGAAALPTAFSPGILPQGEFFSFSERPHPSLPAKWRYFDSRGPPAYS